MSDTTGPAPRQRRPHEITLSEYSTSMTIAQGIAWGVAELKRQEAGTMREVQGMLTDAIARGILDGVTMLRKDELDMQTAIRDGIMAAVTMLALYVGVIALAWYGLCWLGTFFRAH
ncbi:hypothetical protein [Acidocella aromatica]|uniref:Uncharacterized protein n=1 Tax=Acidocella aromatica TaxID=1303579 RepID=A0A840V978_9PROT|nr:hypothetical protein [Acidocella aromatica]MBB5372273.1 hypothetical protein [Acidocella aromatica]